MLPKGMIARNFARVISTALSVLIFSVIYPSLHYANNDHDIALVVYAIIVLIPLSFTYQTKLRWLKLLGWMLLIALCALIIVL